LKKKDLGKLLKILKKINNMTKKIKNINKNQKGFYFEDYEIKNYNTKSKNLNFSIKRVSLVFFIFLFFGTIYSFKIVYLSLIKEENYFLNKYSGKKIVKRQDILDRNNIILAKNTKVYNAAIRPNLVKDKKKLLINLMINFPELNIVEIKENLEKGKFFYLKKKINPLEREKFWNLGEKSIDLSEVYETRIYPQKSLFSHVLGQTNDKGKGISGLEKSFNQILKDSDSSLILSLDSNLQFLIREELIEASKIFKTIGSAALLMDIHNGEILSLVSLPDSDLNKRINLDDPKYLNKITMGVYELGSVFKTFTLAAGLESKAIEYDTKFRDLKNQVRCGKYTIKEHDKLPKDLTSEEILIVSSNIGAIRIAQKIGRESYKNFLQSMELFNKIDFELDEVGTPLKFNWGKCKLATSSYGHGVTTTLLQLAKAYAIIGNGGFKINPTIIKDKNALNEKNEKIISSETSNIMNQVLRKVVSEDAGTANFANISGYDVGGKTGTAYKSINGVYDRNKKRNTFVSLFPMHKPKYLLLVMLDEPKPAPNYIYSNPNGTKHTGERRNTSGWNTVEIAGKIIRKIGPILAINNLQVASNF